MERSARAEGLTELHCLGTITASAFYERHGFEPAGNPNHVGGVPGEFPLRQRIGPIGG